jgi:hypothetical protein
MNERKMEALKIIANSYKIVKPLFQVRSYLYAQGNSHDYLVCCFKNNYDVVTAALVLVRRLSTFMKTRTPRRP